VVYVAFYPLPPHRRGFTFFRDIEKLLLGHLKSWLTSIVIALSWFFLIVLCFELIFAAFFFSALLASFSTSHKICDFALT
jgi:hypothetical protein